MHKGWIGFGLDGTLAEYNNWQGPTHIGKPIPNMVLLAKKLREEGYEIRIFTARVSSKSETRLEALLAITEWCKEVFGYGLSITSEKDYSMVDLYDDRCHRVEMNTGRIIGE